MAAAAVFSVYYSAATLAPTMAEAVAGVAETPAIPTAVADLFVAVIPATTIQEAVAAAAVTLVTTTVEMVAAVIPATPAAYSV